MHNKSFKELFYANKYSNIFEKNIPDANKGGDCYEQALHYMQSDLSATLVHGLVTGQGPLEGIIYNHAWCEKNGKIIDMTLPKAAQKSLPIDFYYSIGHITVTYKYTYDQMLEKMNEFGTYGPWEKKLIRNKY
jgi:hypothetical protein